jgi:predicted PurR-regulated permease PerM
MRRDLLVWATRGLGLALGVTIVGAILFVGLRASNVLLLVFLAILLASGLEPFIGWIRARVPLGRGPTILVVYAMFVVLVGVLVFLLVPAALRQADDFSRSIPAFLQHVREWAATIRPQTLSATITQLVDAASSVFQSGPSPEPSQVVDASLTVIEVLVSVVTLLAIVFFWLVEHARLQRFALSFVPASSRPGWRQAWNEIETRLGLWVRGQLTLMVTIGVATAIAYSVLGLPSALLLGLFAGLCEAIPLVGPTLGAIPAVLIALTVSPQLALVVAVVYIVLQFLEGNVLVPLVMKNTIGLSPFVVIVSLLVGGAVGGIVGAFIAVPFMAAVEVVLERLQARDVPVTQEPAAGVAQPSEETTEEQGRTLPDSGASEPARGDGGVPGDSRAASGRPETPSGRTARELKRCIPPTETPA